MSALALAACATIAVPSTATAKPIPAPQSTSGVPMIPEGVPVEALASLVPAIVGAAAGPADIAAGPQTAILEQARQILSSLNLPPQVKSTLEKIITFLDGSGGGGPELPKEGPVISQFLWPTLGKGCISASADSVGTALAVAGPAQLPPPGPQAGQAGFVFTALGTKRPTEVQSPPMTVQWINLDTRQSGTLALTDEAKINPDGPATLSAIADTGNGRVVAVVSGSLTTQADAESAPITCSFLPTIGFFTV